MFRFALFAASLIACAFADVPNVGDITPVVGESTTIERYPYLVSLRFNGSHFCGGSIISAEKILTAAHCFDQGAGLDAFSIRAGSSLLSQGGTVHNIASINIPEEYNQSTAGYDIAVVKVASPFIFSDAVAAVPLADVSPADGVDAVVTGWRAPSFGRGYSDQLQKAVVPIVSKADCKSSYGSITDRMSCFGYTQGGKDACQGDSGGPVVVDGKQVGVVSWGVGCAQSGFSGVYTSVPQSREWIAVNTGV